MSDLLASALGDLRLSGRRPEAPPDPRWQEKQRRSAVRKLRILAAQEARS